MSKDKLVPAKLGNIAHIEMGQSPDSIYYLSEAVGVPLIQGNADIKERKSIQRIWTSHLTKECDAGDILMTVRAPVGSIGIASHYSCIGRGVCAIKATSIDPNYLYHLLIYNEENWKALEQGSTFTAVNSKEIFNFPLFIVSSKTTQQKIAQILTTADTVIEKTQTAIAKYKAIKQGMLNDLFTCGIDVKTGKLRPKQEDAPELYKESALGWIPKEWEDKCLSSLCSERPTYGINAAAVDFTHQLPTYLRITDIDEDGNFSKTRKKCVDSPFSNQYILKKGDLVFARTGATVGKTYLYNESDGQLVFAGFLIKVSPNERLLNSNFLKFLTETPYYLNWVEVMSQRSGQPGINGIEYGSFLVPKPNLTEQKIISERLLSIQNKISFELKYLIKLQQIKFGLMADLLSGSVKVNCLNYDFKN